MRSNEYFQAILHNFALGLNDRSIYGAGVSRPQTQKLRPPTPSRKLRPPPPKKKTLENSAPPPKKKKIWKNSDPPSPERTKNVTYTGVARGGPGVPVTPLGRPSFEQTTYNIQVAKTPWQYLGRKSHCWKAHFFKICFFVKYFRQRLLSLVNMGVEIDMTIWWVASVTPPLKNPGYAPDLKSEFGVFDFFDWLCQM